MQFIIISGRSGSGKSTALHMLEDIGYYCVDNLPAALMPALATHMQSYDQHKTTQTPSKQQKIAVGIDARNTPTDLSRFTMLLKQIPDTTKVNIIYL